MNAGALHWTPDPFLTEVERRSDGTLLLRPRTSLGAHPARLMDRLEHWAQVAPDRTLVARRGSDGAWRNVTYREMLERVQRVAAGLMTRDLSAERPIVILSGNSIEHLTLAFAAMWAGAPYCPVSPSYSQASADLGRLRHVMELLTPGLVAVFGTSAFERAFAQLAPLHVEIVGDADLAECRVTRLSALETTPSASLVAAHARTNLDTIARFLLTSGSTGRPKAVITTNRMLCSNALMLRQAFPFLASEPPVLVDWLPWNHTFGGSHNVGLVLYNGGTLYIDDGKPTSSGIAETIRNLREISPTIYFNVPKGFEMVAHHLREDEQLRRTFYGRLRACFFAGASLAQHTWDVLDEMSLQERGVRTPMLSGLGATETGPSVTFTTPEMGRSGVIGLPAVGNVVKLARIEEKLEIRVRSPGVTPGYWREPELTAAAFDEEGFYKLGDAVRLLDEAEPTRGLLFDGRIAEDFKLANGAWVSVGPLRTELIAALSPVAQDVVIAGLDCDFIAALIIPDLQGCAQVLRMSELPTHARAATHPPVLGWLRQQLQRYAQRNPASTRCVRRAMVLPSGPSLDHGEITDKGSINQRAVLRHRAECVAALYAHTPPAQVIDILPMATAGTLITEDRLSDRPLSAPG
ncbi:MAG: feruloyl-CoA synthase [Steroidobacter sp.]